MIITRATRQSSTRRATLPGRRKRLRFFQKHCGTGDEHAIADLICNLGHLADVRGFDFLDEARRGIGHWYAERHASDSDRLGPDAAVEITIAPMQVPQVGTWLSPTVTESPGAGGRES